MSRYTVHSVDKNQDIESVADVSFSKTFSNEATICDIEIYSREEALEREPDETIEVLNQNGERVFLGQMKEIPTGDPQRTYQLRAKQRYVEAFEFESNNRIFYESDSGEVMRKLITEDIESRGKEIALRCDDTDIVESNAPVVELGKFRQLRPHEYGDDFIFLGFPKDIATSSWYSATFDGIDFKGDELHSIELRLIINNISGLFKFNVQYIDNEGTNYVWELGAIDGLKDIELRVDEARDIEITQMLDPYDEDNHEKLRIIFDLKGEPVESRAIGVDVIKTASFDVFDRAHGFNEVNIPNTGRRITRKFTESVSEALFAILEEEDGKLIVDEEDNVEFREVGESDSELEIIKGETPVVNFDIDTDVEEIRNRVVVQGDDDLVVTKTSDSSRRFFGFTKTLKRRDESIKRATDAEDKANELLNELAFKDTKIRVQVPDIDVFEQARVGDNINIEWDNIQGDFVLEEIDTVNRGFIELTMKAESYRF